MRQRPDDGNGLSPLCQPTILKLTLLARILTMIAPEDLVGEEWAEWYRLTPIQRWRESQKLDRKSTRLNSSHGYISYAVFCLKKKKTQKANRHTALPPETDPRQDARHVH